MNETSTNGQTGHERSRLAQTRRRDAHWRRWGPYLSERQWGTVREDYSARGTAWESLPHDHARSRAYRLGEDGLLGISDNHQRLCFALALWNGRDPILKERLFGLTGVEGNHGEDVKEYYFYLDNVPTHAYMKALYEYPHAAFPYEELVGRNRARDRRESEYELLDTGVFDEGRYFDVFVSYAKAGPDDVCVEIEIVNRGDVTAPLHVLPTLWFRNDWSWKPDVVKPAIHDVSRGDGHVLRATHPTLGTRYLYGEAAHDVLFTDNETNAERLFGTPNASPFVKDGIGERVVHGRTEAVNAARAGTKASLWHVLSFGRRNARSSGCASPTGAICAMRSDANSTPSSRRVPLRPTHSTRISIPFRSPRTRGVSNAKRSRGCSGASSSITTWCATGSRAMRRNRDRMRRARGGGIASGAISSTTTSSRCPTSGNIRGLPRGISLSTSFRSRWSTPNSRSHSSCC